MKYNFKDIGLIGIAVLFFCGFIMKAYYIPITFDESRTCLYYSQLPIHSIIFYDNPWPTNHVLNSLVIKLFTNIWGISQMVCRIPTLLFSFIYLVYCIKISKIMCNNGFIRISIFIIFLCNPYVNDFFSLARGYGMAISLMMTSIYYLVRFIITPKYALIVYSLGFSFLAVESNFTWLVYFGGLTLCMGLAILYFYKLDKINKEQLVKFVLIEFLITIVTLAFIILPIIKMSSTDQFQYWKGDSFFNVTLVSMFNNFMYSRSYIKIAPEDIMLIWSVLISICLTIGFRLIKNNKSNEFSILSIASILFICTLIVNISQHIILHTPYLIGRTAILYHPLVSFLLSATICFFYNFYSRIVIKIAGIISFLIIIHLSLNFNLKYFAEWWFDKNTFEVINFLKENKKPGEVVELNTHWMFQPSFNFYKTTQHLDWLKLQSDHHENQKDSLWTYYYTFNEEDIKMKPEYHLIKGFEGNSRVIYMLNDSLIIAKKAK